jgi:hypothetical protein
MRQHCCLISLSLSLSLSCTCSSPRLAALSSRSEQGSRGWVSRGLERAFAARLLSHAWVATLDGRVALMPAWRGGCFGPVGYGRVGASCPCLVSSPSSSRDARVRRVSLRTGAALVPGWGLSRRREAGSATVCRSGHVGRSGLRHGLSVLSCSLRRGLAGLSVPKLISNGRPF